MDGVQQTEANEKYFALQLGKKFLDAAREAERNYYYTCKERGLWQLWWLIYCQVLGIDPNNGASNVNQQVRFAGDQDQYVQFRVQLTRSLIQQYIMMAKDQRPSFEGVATNNDVASLTQVSMGTKAIDYMLTEAKLEQQGTAALESNGYYGAGGLYLKWDFAGGDLVPATEQAKDPETGEPITNPVLDRAGNQVVGDDGQPAFEPLMTTVQKKSGAPKIVKKYPWEYALEPYLEDDHPWVIVKTPVNKHELAAKFKEKAKEIRACTIDYDLGDDAMFAWGSRTSVSSDIVVMREYYHRNCEAVPGGRYAAYVCDVPLIGVEEMMRCPLDDGLPFEPIIAGRYFCTAFGYPVASDLLAVQQVLNEGLSQGLTSIIRHGNPNLWKHDSIQVDQRAYTEGGHMFDLPAGVPPPTLDQPPRMSEMWKFFIEFCKDVMPAMIGSNDTVRGDPQGNIDSGAFAVLMVNLVQQYMSLLQEAFDHAMTGIANKSLELTRKNAVNGFMYEIAGVSSTPYMQMFKTQEIGGLRRLKLVRRNPVLSTFVGRLELFNAVKDLPKQDRQDALEMLLNSNTDSFAERDQSRKIRIRKENERMLQGIMAEVSVTDPHHLEVPEHIQQRDKLVTQDPDPDPAKENQRLTSIKMLDEHIMAHGVTWAQTPIPILVACGTPPIQVLLGGGGSAADQPGQEKPDGAAQSGKPGGGKPSNQIPQAPKPPKPPAGANREERA